MSRKRALFGLLIAAAIATGAIFASGIAGAASTSKAAKAPPAPATRTPIKHVVVIFQENVSFDHYFGTYPNASGADGQPFSARPGTPAVDGLTPATDATVPASLQHTTDLTVANPNKALPQRLQDTANGPVGGQGGLLTCDQDHNYSDEQQSFDGDGSGHAAMDQFVQAVGANSEESTFAPSFVPGTGSATSTPKGIACDPKAVMDFYDGNAVTGLWNYAQHFSMSDNSFGTTFGPSAPGAINLASGDTGGVDTSHMSESVTIATATAPNADLTADGGQTANGQPTFSLTSDAQPYYDDCSTRDAGALKGANIGDELNQDGLSWGWFQGGFRPTTTFAAAAAATGHTGQSTSTFIPDEFSGSFAGKVTPPNASNQALCNAVHAIGPAVDSAAAAAGKYGYKDDYIAHHEPFEYYATTANPHHITVATDNGGNDLVHGTNSLSTVGTDTQTFSGAYGTGPQFNTPNHNYDTSDFDQLVSSINTGALPATALPAVTFLKAPGYEDGHAQYSDPADEQTFVTSEVDALMKSPDWSSTVVFVSYDDSDGWYDHVYSGVLNPSASPGDNLTGTKTGQINLTNPTSGTCGPVAGSPSTPLGGQNGRCGLGPRLPLIAISPCSAPNAVDHNLSNQASIINFIEYNWNLPSIAGSFDHAQASIDSAEGVPFDLAGMFDFTNCGLDALPLNTATGQINLAGFQFKGAQQGTDYAHGNLTGASLASLNFAGSFLEGTNLTNGDLRGTSFLGADLAEANLTNAQLQESNLRGATLAGANLTNANFANATLKGANISGVTWSNTTCPDSTTSTQDGGTCAGHLTQ